MLLIAVGLISCGETATENGNTNTADTTATNQTDLTTNGEGDDIMEDPAEAQLAQLEALNQWKRFLDAHDGELSVEKLEYGCDHWGGNVTYTHDGESLRVISVLNAAEHGHSLDKYYFDENDALVMILFENGSWIGDRDEITQTLYYISNNAPFYATRKSVEGPTKEIETILAAAEMQEIEADLKGFDSIVSKISDYKGLNAENIEAFFCD
ncbi:MAG: hypothetical protein GY810_17430 [Aureispira sp.]|nr:hypothetical protein [Aureispira sp.]